MNGQASESSRNFDKSNYLLLGLIAILWGSSFILIKKSLIAFSPLQLAALRMGIAGIVLAPFGYHKIREIPRKTWPAVCTIGLVGSLIPALFFAIAQTRVPSGVSACLNALVPLYTFLLGVLFFTVDFEKKKLVGVLLGLAGAVLLILTGKSLQGGSYASYSLFIVAAGIMYATSANTIRHYCSELKPMTLTLGVFATITPLSIAIVLFSGVKQTMQHPQFWESFAAISLLAIVGTAFANLLFFRVAQRTSALFASSVTYLIPIVAIFWGLWDQESFGIGQTVGLLLTVSGVYLSNRK